MKILIVDDDASMLTMLKLHLLRAGFRVETASDPAAAEAALAASRFDWLVVDGQLHAGDGFALAARARELQPGLDAVMISGFYDRGDIAGRPIRALFQKPVDTEALIAYLRGGGPAVGSPARVQAP